MDTLQGYFPPPLTPPQTTGKRSSSFGKLAEALSKAQGQMEAAKKDAANPFFKSKYADLASVIDAIKKPLSDNGLAYIQLPRAAEGGVEVETILCHTSGEFISETLCLPVSKADAQGVGSAITYARRYGLQSIAGVAADDDDGNAAAKSAGDIREKGIAILKTAAGHGTKALESAWNTMSNDMRLACKNDLHTYKTEAKKNDKPEVAHANGN